MTKKRKVKASPYQKSSPEKVAKSNNTQLIFTIISICISIIGAFFTYINYVKSIPLAHLENWKIEIVKPTKTSHSEILFITADFSNLGRNATSLIKSNLYISYENVPEKADPTAISTSEPLILQRGDGYSIVAEFPGITNPEEVVCVLRQTGLLEFVDMSATPVPTSTSTNYILDDQYLCFDTNDCRLISDDADQAVLAFTGDKQKIITDLLSGYVTSDDTPIFLLPGESKRIFLAWYIPFSCGNRMRPKDFEINLNFNNKQNIVLNVTDKVKYTP